MVPIEEISGPEAHLQLQEFLSKQEFLPLFFFSPYVLNTWLTHAGKKLYRIKIDKEYLIIHKKENNDVRIIFDHPNPDLIEVIKDYFKPKYLAVNEVLTPPQTGIFLSAPEIEIGLSPVAELHDKSVRKKYRQNMRKHPQLVFQPYSSIHIEKIQLFLQRWKKTRSEEKNKFEKTENDFHFISLYGNHPDLTGGVVFDGDDIVSISLCVPSMDGKILAVLNKVLRGYTELGVFTYVERARHLINKGYGRAYVGAINNDFKKQFLTDSIAREVYCYEIMRSPDFEASERYLFRLF